MFIRHNISYYTVYRYIKIKYQEIEKPLVDNIPVKENFTFDQVKHMWQGDMLVGPYTNVGRKRNQPI
ncbi:MAG: hypothetical protein ACOX6E_01560 [Syntrophomonadaceae bacterium]|jgi:hypothetical protein